MGAADDWTPPEPCRILGARAGVRYIEYPGAYHDFDAPDVLGVESLGPERVVLREAVERAQLAEVSLG